MIITEYVRIFKKGGKYEDIIINKLSLKSHKIVLVRCDICLNEKEVKYQDYNKSTSNQQNTYHCSKCKFLKINETKKEIYGNDLKMIVDKLKSSIILKYGVDNISKLDSIKRKKAETCLVNYGVDIPSKSKFVREKMMKTCLERYGVNFALQNEEIRNKISKTNMERYGVENTFQSNEVKLKIKKSLLNRYGCDHPMRNALIFEKQMKSSFRLKEFDGINYQGSYELDFIIFCKSFNFIIERGPTIKYQDYIYHPDFYLKDKNLIVEIKSTYTYQKELDKNLKKKKACLDIGYNFIFIIDKDYTRFIELMLI